MKTDSPDIDKQALCRLLKVEYGLEVATLSFVPEGEESYGYVAQTSPKRHYFVKVYEHPSDLDVRYEAANKLHTQCDLEYVVCPYETRQGRFHSELGEYAVAVFNFVEGTVPDQSGFTDEEWEQAAILTALLHASVQCSSLPSLPTEQFEIWFKDWLLNVLTATDGSEPLENQCEQRARKLLASEKDDILATLKKLERLTERAHGIEWEQALTHGDLTPENFIKDSDGNLHIVDWSKIAVAPPERDLVNFVGERFGLFLTQYVRAYGRCPRLHPELFEYYSYFLILWGIADYGSWILLEDANPIEKEHAWKRLQQYLPIDHENVQGEASRIGQAIQRASGAAQPADGPLVRKCAE
jgi:spectinomycin phosphotransferase